MRSGQWLPALECNVSPNQEFGAMLQSVSLSHSVDFDALRDYLDSERAPEGCMDYSELDGFLAGLAAGPEIIAPTEWWPVIWDGKEPKFDSEKEARQIPATVLRRYDDITGSLDADPSSFAPIFWEADDGSPIVEAWAYGFMQAVALRADAWDTVLNDEDTAILLIPIGIIAGLGLSGIGMPVNLTEAAVAELMEDADMMLTACAVGLRAFWRDHVAAPRVLH
jgi:uncharacterized protein